MVTEERGDALAIDVPVPNQSANSFLGLAGPYEDCYGLGPSDGAWQKHPRC